MTIIHLKHHKTKPKYSIMNVLPSYEFSLSVSFRPCFQRFLHYTIRVLPVVVFSYELSLITSLSILQHLTLSSFAQ